MVQAVQAVIVVVVLWSAESLTIAEINVAPLLPMSAIANKKSPPQSSGVLNPMGLTVARSI